MAAAATSGPPPGTGITDEAGEVREPAADGELAGDGVEERLAEGGRHRSGDEHACGVDDRGDRGDRPGEQDAGRVDDRRWGAAQRPVGLRLDGAGAHVGVETADSPAGSTNDLRARRRGDRTARRFPCARRAADPPTPLPRRPSRRRAGRRSRAGRRRARTTLRPRRRHGRHCRSPPASRRPPRVGLATGSPSIPGAAPTPSLRRRGRSDRDRRRRSGWVAHPPVRRRSPGPPGARVPARRAAAASRSGPARSACRPRRRRRRRDG